MKTETTLLACLTLALCLGAGATSLRAQSVESTSGSSGESWQTEPNQSQFTQSSDRTIRGRIQSLRNTYLRNSEGLRQRHTLARIQLESGRVVTADLGPKRALDELDLETGDRITLQGHRGTIDGNPTFFADQVRSGGEVVDVNRNPINEGQGAFGGTQFGQSSGAENPSGSRGGSFREQGNHFTLKGKVTGFQVINLESGQRQVSMLSLRLANGQTVLIDAGSNPGQLDLKDLQLRDRVVIQGHTRDVDGREVLVADKVQFVNPEQSSEAMGQSGQQERSSGSGSSQESSQHHEQSQQQ